MIASARRRPIKSIHNRLVSTVHNDLALDHVLDFVRFVTKLCIMVAGDSLSHSIPWSYVQEDGSV